MDLEQPVDTIEHLVPVKKKSITSCLARFSKYAYISTMGIIYTAICFTMDPYDHWNLVLDTTAPRNEIYRWYTYSLLHVGWLHWLMNMFTLATYGFILSFDHPNWRIMILHLFTILNGAFAVGIEERIYNREGGIQVVGASGGIYGLLSAQFGNMLINWSELTTIQRIMYPLVLASAIVAEIVVNAVTKPENVSFSNHIGGFVAGIFGGIAILRNFKVLPWEVYVRTVAFVLLSIYTIVGMVCYLTLSNVEDTHTHM